MPYNRIPITVLKTTMASESEILEGMMFDKAKGVPPAIVAVRNCSLVRFEYQLSTNKLVRRSIFDRDEQYRNWTALHYAAVEGYTYSVQLLVDYGADSNAQDTEGQTPLHVAADTGGLRMCQAMLERGPADPNITDNEGDTPLHVALRYNTVEVVQLFIDYGADLGAINSRNVTAIHLAASNSYYRVLRYLLERGLAICSKGGKKFKVDIDIGDGEDKSPLMYAAESGCLENCKCLLEHGADVTRRSSVKGCTPLTLIITSGSCGSDNHLKTIELLLESGADVFDDETGMNALEYAATNERMSGEVRALLMRHVAKLQYKKFPITERNKKLINDTVDYKKHYEKYAEELESMKKTKVYKTVYVLDLLVGSREKIAGYVRYDGLVKAMGKARYSRKFPLYHNLMRKRFDAAVERHGLETVAMKILSEIFKFNTDIIGQRIASFLDNESLRVLGAGSAEALS